MGCCGQNCFKEGEVHRFSTKNKEFEMEQMVEVEMNIECLSQKREGLSEVAVACWGRVKNKLRQVQGSQISSRVMNW